MKNDFPKIKKVISFGSAQSNAMYSLSVLCKIKGWKFDYYVDHIASYLKENPIGNYKFAKGFGMNIIEAEVPKTFKDDELFISEGGAVSEASFGIEILANEIRTWAKENQIKNLKVFLPSGTGTTSLYLQKFLPFEVLTCSCVGDDEYLEKQFLALEKTNFPTILKKEKKYHFGKLYKELYEIHKELLKQTNIEFDLLYDSLGWLCFEKYVENFDKKDEFNFLYIHQGGLLGNISMKERYTYKYNS